MPQIRLHSVHYNAHCQAFEARVDVIRDDGVFRYPCRMPGPADMAFDLVTAGLAHQALRMSDSPGRTAPF